MLDEQTPTEPGNGPATSEAGAGSPGASDTPEGAASTEAPAPRKRAPRKSTAKKTAAAAPEADQAGDSADDPATDATPEAEPAPTDGPPPRRRTRKTAAKKTAASADTGAEQPAESATGGADPAGEPAGDAEKPAKKTPAKRTRKTTAKQTTASESQPGETGQDPPGDTPQDAAGDTAGDMAGEESTGQAAPALLFVPPDPAAAKAAKKTSSRSTTAAKASTEQADGADGADRADDAAASAGSDEAGSDDEDNGDGSEENEGGPRRRRRRGGRRRRKGSDGSDSSEDGPNEDADGRDEADKQSDGQGPTERQQSDSDGEGGSSSSRRRRRRRRAGDGDDDGSDESDGSVRVRKPRSAEDEITGFSGSTRLEAKKQRRREGREAGRRRAPIISEAEFLARRESVDRKMVIRQRDDLTQIAVLEDKVLVEHYVARDSQTSLIGNVYLGRVQNVLPSMEAAFIDIGKGRNAVLYAGEVNWDSLGAKDGNQRKIEQVLKPGQPVLVQVTKDPIGHKGARLTSQVSLPGRFLVYVPDGNTSGISRKLPENERNRLKTLLKEIVPDTAGVIVRTAAEGASEDELTRDVERLKALWEDISKKVESGNAPQLLYGEPDLTLKVVRDLFTEDIAKLVVSGAEAWEMVESYVNHVAPDLADRLEKHDDSERDAFAEYRIDEQINKALDRKVWLPSGGSLVIDRTEAMTVVDVNTGKFTGSGGNLEETVTKNNLEAAEEIVRQLRLRDIGGIIVIDFIDMVLESNRDLVLRRLIECLGRDRTRHQVAEVTSLGLVQMTRKRIGTGLLEAFSEPCEHCQGRGLHVHQEPVEQKRKQTDDEPRRGRRNRGRGKGGDDQSSDSGSSGPSGKTGEVRRPTPAEFAAMARVEPSSDDAAKAAESRPDGDVSASAAEPERSKEEPNEEKAASGDLPKGDQPDDASQPGAPSDFQPDSQPDSQPGAEGEQPMEPTPPPPPAAPRIVTSVRRVGARRPAGPPPGLATAVVATPDETAAPGTGPQEPVASGAGPQESIDPSQPSVDGLDGADGTDGAGGADGVGQSHVPVKKKGARKR